MNGNFTYHNPTRLHFGENAMEFLKDELAAFGPTVQLCYGGGSIKKNGIYDQVVAALKAEGDFPTQWRLQAAYRRRSRGNFPSESVTQSTAIYS